ncbi:MAG: ATP-binding cassette domain-containing protein [Fibrobacteria bacterium]|nr:ATP-binding cassette domain-containing protein [Fibrobacteria bacterium]
MNKVLQVRHLKTWFPVTGGVFKRVQHYLKAVDDVSISINESEIIAVVGESGCGKSTLGRSILGLTPVRDGEIVLSGHKLDIKKRASWDPFRKEYQIIFQDPYSSLNPRHTVFEILSEPLLVHKICSKKDVRERVGDLLEKVGLSKDYIDRFPHAFSGGQRQRLGIARVIGLSPRLIICDEIVSALDVSVQAQIIHLLLKLKKEMNLSLMFISHDLSLINTISDAVYVMYLGKIVESGLREEIFNAPRHPYTQSLLKAIPTLDINSPPIILPGEPPSLSHVPAGCSFHSRCPFKQDKCVKEIPPLQGEDFPQVACHFPLERP